MSLLVDDNDAVGVAIKRNADIGAHLAHFAAQRIRRRRAAFAIDIEAVGLDADRDDIGTELPERIRRHPVAGAIGAIDHHPQAFEREIARQRALGKFDVAVVDAVDPLGAAEFAAFGEAFVDVGVDQLFDAVLDLVRELVAVGPKKLDAVVVERVMRRRNHDAEVGAHRTGQHRNSRRRHRSEQQHVHADRGEAGHQRGLDHVPGEPGILADHDTMTVFAAAEDEPGSLSRLKRQFGCDHAIGAAANAVSAKILPGHNPHRLPFQASILPLSP